MFNFESRIVRNFTAQIYQYILLLENQFSKKEQNIKYGLVNLIITR